MNPRPQWALHSSMADQETKPSPSVQPVSLGPNISLQHPLSRRGVGPGLILLVPEDYNLHPENASSRKTLDPEPMQKWAEEGFAVVQIRYGSDHQLNKSNCARGLDVLRELGKESKYGKTGLIGYESKGYELGQTILRTEVFQALGIDAYVTFMRENSKRVLLESGNKGSLPRLHHVAGTMSNEARDDSDEAYAYDVPSESFILPGHEHHRSGPAGVAHTRTLKFLKKHLGGPNFDLEAIWEEHCKFEFGERDVERTMATMVDEPYVNHIPTMTGGIGRAALTAFYRDHFIFNNPEDTNIELVSRTVGVDRVIDEFIFSFTHDKVIDWLIPGIPPTNKKVRVPFTSVVNIRGDRLYHEHIAWDQASVLRQLGLLPEWLPFPYPMPDGRTPGKGKRFEFKLPVAGEETARKLVDEGSVGSNGLFLGESVREVDDV